MVDYTRLRLRDRIAPEARVLFVGINPGVRSALAGHHFAGPSNGFWKILYDSGLVPERVTHVDDDRLPLLPGEVPQMKSVRFRTLGCWPLTAAVPSTAADLDSVVAETLGARTSERQGRLIDHDQAGAMERKKQEGYF